VNGILGLVGAVVAVLGAGVTGWFTYRGTRTAAAIQAGPQAKQVDLAVLTATVERVDKENQDLRQEVHGLRSLVRSLGRAYEQLYQWASAPVGEPPDPEDRVKEYLRTGV
jgi:hypothetical protein